MKILRAAPLLLVAVAAPAFAQKTPACVKFWGQTVATGSGYNHVVSIENGCDKDVECVVSTDVAPDPIRATVAAKQRTDLVTFRGSPSYAFKPSVSCR